MLTLPMLTDATATGKGPVVAPERPELSVHVWVNTGTATVLLLGSNDPRAKEAPAAAAWSSLTTFSLSGVNDSAAIRDVVPMQYLCLEVTAVGGGAKVSGKLGI